MRVQRKRAKSVCGDFGYGAHRNPRGQIEAVYLHSQSLDPDRLSLGTSVGLVLQPLSMTQVLATAARGARVTAEASFRLSWRQGLPPRKAC